jgi:hypothetical protein
MGLSIMTARGRQHGARVCFLRECGEAYDNELGRGLMEAMGKGD